MTALIVSVLACDFEGCDRESTVYFEKGQHTDSRRAAYSHRSMARIDGRRWWSDDASDRDLCFEHRDPKPSDSGITAS